MEKKQEKLLLSTRYNPFHYFFTRPVKELTPLMEDFLQLMQVPDENKSDPELFKMTYKDTELTGKALWDVVLREALIYSQFMVRTRTESGDVRLKPPAIFFHLHPDLVQKYQEKDPVSLTCQDIKESFGPIYIHFGQAAGIVTSHGGKVIDGAYVVSKWDNKKKHLTLEMLLAPEAPILNNDFRGHSLLKRMSLDSGYTYLWLTHSPRKGDTVYKSLDLNISSNKKGVPAKVLLHDQLQLREAVKACQIVIPFLGSVTNYLTLARKNGLGRKDGCSSMETEGVRIRRAVKKNVELLLVDAN